MTSSPGPHDQAPRPSTCAKQSLAAEQERIRRLTVEERILLALGLRKRFEGLGAPPRPADRHGE